MSGFPCRSGAGVGRARLGTEDFAARPAQGAAGIISRACGIQRRRHGQRTPFPPTAASKGGTNPQKYLPSPCLLLPPPLWQDITHPCLQIPQLRNQ